MMLGLFGVIASSGAAGGPVGVAGYFAGGYNTSYAKQSTVDKFAFPGD